MTRPLLYDVFAGAGGCSAGYVRAGFRVVGIDNRPQPRYLASGAEDFMQMDAFDFFNAYQRGEFPEASAFHCSPPCQGYSRMRHLPWLKDKVYPLLIDQTRRALTATGALWVIENVEDAPLLNGITLCGTMFGLRVYRHRKFESNVLLLAPPHHPHKVVVGSGRMLNERAKPNADGSVSLPSKGSRINGLRGNTEMRTVAGHFSDVDDAHRAMGVDFQMTRDELAQAIPPAFTCHVGSQLLTALAVPIREAS